MRSWHGKQTCNKSRFDLPSRITLISFERWSGDAGKVSGSEDVREAEISSASASSIGSLTGDDPVDTAHERLRVGITQDCELLLLLLDSLGMYPKPPPIME